MTFISVSFTVLLSVVTCCAFGQGEPEISTENVFNPRESIRKARISKEFIYVYLVKKGRLVDSTIASMLIYDTAGNIIKYERFDAPVVGQIRYDYQYNEQGLVSKILVTRPKNQNSTIDLMYDSAGNEIVRSTNSKFTSLIEWKEFDERGRLIRQYEKYNGGKRHLAFTNTWSNNDRLLTKQGLDEFAKPSFSEMFKYSLDSLRVQKFLSNKFLTKLQTETIYNTDWQITMSIRYQDDLQNHTDYSYSYNSNGTISEWSASYRNKLVYLKRHVYYFFDY